jgi:hypothetical protein
MIKLTTEMAMVLMTELDLALMMEKTTGMD